MSGVRPRLARTPRRVVHTLQSLSSPPQPRRGLCHEEAAHELFSVCGAPRFRRRSNKNVVVETRGWCRCSALWLDAPTFSGFHKGFHEESSMTLENGTHAELIKKERIKFVSSAVSNTVDYEHVIKKKKKRLENTQMVKATNSYHLWVLGS